MVSKAAMKGMSENLANFMPIVKNEANRVTKRKRSGSKEKADQVSLKRIGTIKRPAKNEEERSEKNGQATAAETSGWSGLVESVIETVRDLVDSLPFMVKAGVAVLLMLWIMISWLRAGPRQNRHQQDKNQMVEYPPVASRAVYLRDINEGLLNMDMRPAYGHSDR